jgi:hypothetical protein
VAQKAEEWHSIEQTGSKKTTDIKSTYCVLATRQKFEGLWFEAS